ncbi:MAG: cell division protein FtsZ [Erysipelotrichaceae bacterium]|nr:cell division protein FtsZ [Erysipelotrichaceae bacterium]
MTENNAKIKVFGVGGAGCNSVGRMVAEGVENVEFYVVNTDAPILDNSICENKIYLGTLGAGGNPEVGRKAAMDHESDLREALKDAEMVFITAGLGGGTGTGAAPVVARLAKEQGSLTVAVVTKPFPFEGRKRMMQALNGLDDLKQFVDSLIVISNAQVLETIGSIPMGDAFKEADNILRQAVQTVTDLITQPLLINLDFADIKSVMENQGSALIGIGMAQGENKAREAATKAIQSPLLEAQITGAKNAIVNVTGGPGVTLQDASIAANTITAAAGNDVNIIWGALINEKLGDYIIVTVIATGFEMAEENKVVSGVKEPVTTGRTEDKPKNDGNRPVSFAFRDL